MRIHRVIAALSAAVALSACQTTPPADTHEWRQVASGPDYETALAFCEMQGIAITPPTQYVFGGTFADQMAVHSRNNAMQARQGQFVMRCLRAQGWALVPIGTVAQ